MKKGLYRILVLVMSLMLLSSLALGATVDPEYPTPSDDVEICVDVPDVNGSVVLSWTLGSQSGNPPMANVGGTTYCKTLSATTIEGRNDDEVTFTISDDSGLIDEGSFVYDNAEPVAEANGPYTCDEGDLEPLSSDGSSDNHPDRIMTYSWTAENGGDFDDASSDSPGFSCFGPSGEYEITLEVTDFGGRTASDTAMVTISNVAPEADAGGPYFCPEGGSVTLDGSGSTDTGFDVLTYEWDLDNDGDFDDAFGVAPVFECGDGLAVFPIALRVSDEAESSEDTSKITVLNSAPSVKITGPNTVDEGSLLLLTVSFTDYIGDTHSAVVNWGDGTDSEVLADVTSPFVIEHTFADGVNPGRDLVNTVSVRVTDDDSATGNKTHDVRVMNVAPTADVGGPYHAERFVEFTFAGSATDPAGDLDTLTYFWIFDYDDAGSPVDPDDFAEASNTAGVDLTDPEHTYDSTGDRTVALMVCDEGFTLRDLPEFCSEIETVDITVTDVVMDLHAGWNLISFPYMPDDNSLDAVIFDLVGDNMADGEFTVFSYQFNEITGASEWVGSKKDGEGDLDSVVPGYAYWVKMSSDDVIYYNGDNFLAWGVPGQVQLAPSSWNLIGKFGNTPVAKEFQERNLGFHDSMMMSLRDYPVLAVNDVVLEDSELLSPEDSMLPKEGFWTYMAGNDGFGAIDYIPSNADLEEEGLEST